MIRNLKCFSSLTDANEFIRHHAKNNPIKKGFRREYGIKKRSVKKSGQKPFQAYFAESKV